MKYPVLLVSVFLMALAPLYPESPRVQAAPEGHVLIGDSLLFQFDPVLYGVSGKIRSVSVTGYFNSWDDKKAGWQLADPEGDNLWELLVPDGGKYLGYRFRFVVNGKTLSPPAETESRFIYTASDGTRELLIGGERPNRWLEHSLAGEVPLADGGVLPYRIILPEHYDPSRSYPLVLFFHGSGERGSDNRLTLAPCNGAFEFLETASQNNEFIMIVPQCPADSWWTRFDRKPTPALTGALTLLDTVMAEYPVDPMRIYVTGLSMGGFASWETVFRRPRIFAGGLILCAGYFGSIAPTIKRVPFSVWHGKNDPVSPVLASREIVRALKKQGGTVLFTELEDGHDIWIEVYSDPEAVDWLFRQSRYP